MFAQVNALPGAQRQSPRRNRQQQLAAQQTGLEVRGQVIRPFIVMFMSGHALGHQPVEKTFEVTTYCRIGILVDGQRGRGMLQPQVQQTDSTIPQLRQACQYLVSDQMEPARPGPQGNSGLMPHTVLRTFGAHSNSPEKKAKRAINRLPCTLTKTVVTTLQALRHVAEIIDAGTSMTAEIRGLSANVRQKNARLTGHSFFSAAAFTSCSHARCVAQGPDRQTLLLR